MSKLFNDDLRKQLKDIFSDMPKELTIALFIDKEQGCQTCSETQDYMEEVAELNDRIHLKIHDINEDQLLAERYNVQMVPSIVLLDSNGDYHGVKFNGMPAGHEINSFIPALLETSGLESEVPEPLKGQIEQIDKSINIKVFVTLSCPHCAGAVQKAHKLAMMNEHIDAEMVEAQTFYELANKHNVSGVPKIVINDRYELVGNQPITAFLDEIAKVSA
jgi:glutaredoxin-like protein